MVANCSPASALKHVPHRLLAEGEIQVFRDCNGRHSSAWPVPGAGSAPWTGAAAHPKSPHLPPNPPISPTTPTEIGTSSPTWSVLDRSLPAPHVWTSLHSANITELPILPEIKSILERRCCKASSPHGTPEHSWHELSQLHRSQQSSGGLHQLRPALDRLIHSPKATG